MAVSRWFALILLAGAAGVGRADAPCCVEPDPFVAAFQRLGKLEAVEMLTAILSGKPPVPGAGWFHPGQSRYGWKWLAEHRDADRDGAVTRREFGGPAEFFERLDRDRNGRLTPEDFDWSPQSPLRKQAQLADQFFRRADTDSDGRLSAEEWQALFRKAARGKEAINPEDLRELLFPPAPPRRSHGDGMPARLTLLLGLLRGEIGSLAEGPRLGQLAPDFKLKTHDGKHEFTLAQFRGRKPVVLVFGSFT